MNTKEAIERIKTRFDKWALDDEDLKAIQALIPDLAESEDERIRKDLVNVIKWLIANPNLSSQYYKDRYAEMLAWLEKQKEQKSIEDVAKEVCKDKESAMKFLKSAGIMDENGELAEQYRSEQKPKQGWSEEDETGFKDALWAISKARESAKDENDMGNIWFAENWLRTRLKSLSPQPHWTPSEEQMKALKYVTYHLMPDENYRDEMFSLYNDLKKLYL